MIKFHDIALRRGPNLLFETLTQSIHDGERVGLVGGNGSGKSSLFLMLLDKLHADHGELDLPAETRISHVAQETPNDNRSALDHVLDGDKEFRKVEAALRRLEDDHGIQSAKLHARMDEIGGYGASASAAKLLSGLGFKPNDHNNATSSFSGGWRVRLNLAQALMAPSDLLLLDEPTNHLDLDAIVWLEEWLKKYPGTLIIISHDRDFIDGCCKRILHIEHHIIHSYMGNYSQFERQRAERLANEQSMQQKQQKKIAHIESYIRRFRYKASKARQAQSRIKALEKMQLIMPAHLGSPFNFEFKSCERLSDPILKLENADMGYEANKVLRDVSLSISGGDRIGLLGANGAGKSTLIKAMAGELSLQSGTRLAAKKLNIGYFAQHQLEQLDHTLTPMMQFQQQYPAATTQELRSFLGGFDFRGSRVDQPIGPFSGGEKARLALALLIYSRPNLLLLDEPTNHLDMEMRHALNVAMQSYEGAIILVSHDRSLINSVADRLFLIRSGKVEVFADDLDVYLRILKQLNSGKTEVSIQDKIADKHKAGILTKKQRRQIMAKRREQLKPRRSRVRELEIQMQKLQKKIDDVNVILNQPETYETESTATLACMMQRKSDLEISITRTEADWYAAAEVLEELELSLVME